MLDLSIMDKRPIGIDLFAGAGGMSIGFEQAGFDIAAAVEIDPIHAAVHHFNFPKTTVLASSIVNLTACEVRNRSRIGRRSVDVVFGGPPCQGFSLMGQRMLDDLIALFKLGVCEGDIRIVEERHYKLVPADCITRDDLCAYDK